MRILLLNFEYPPIGGGAAYATQNLIREFSRQGVIVDVITSNLAHRDTVERIGKTVTIYRLDVGKQDIHFWRAKEVARYLFRGRTKMRELLRAHRYNLIHAFFTYPCGFMSQFQRQLPYIVSLRGYDVPGFSQRIAWLDAVNKPMVRMVWAGAAHVVANSEGLKALARRTSAKQSISVICNGINTQEFHPRIPFESAGAVPEFSPVRPLKILCVSRLIARKGIANLVDAIRLLKTIPVTLTIVGDGDLYVSLAQQAKGLPSMLTRYVAHDKLLSIYQDHDIFVLPSQNEGMSNTILEAMACGLPIITTNTGGTAELISDNGIVLKTNAPASIAKAIKTLHKEPGKIISMGISSRRSAEARGWDKLANQYLALYQQYKR